MATWGQQIRCIGGSPCGHPPYDAVRTADDPYATLLAFPLGHLRGRRGNGGLGPCQVGAGAGAAAVKLGSIDQAVTRRTRVPTTNILESYRKQSNVPLLIGRV